MAHTLRSIFWSLIGIMISGAAGGVAGWAVISVLGWSGVLGALVAAAIGMVVATAVFVMITVLLRAIGLVR
jgi:hypothetical protein